MKNKALLLLFIVLLSNCIPAYSQWTQVLSTPSYIVRSIVKCRNTFYAGTSTGHFDMGQLYSSSDNGLTWSLVNVGFPFSGVFAMAVNGDHIYIGTYEDGALISSDAGQTWSLNGITPFISGVFGVGVSGTSNVIAYTNSGSGLYLSTNDGSNWSALNPGSQILQLQSFLDLPGKLLAGARKGIVISTNNGANWSLQSNTGLIANPDGTKPTRALYYFHDKLFTGCISKIYTSTDYGNNFVPTNYTLNNFEYITSFTSLGNKLFAGVYKPTGSTTPSIMMTTDDGQNWTNYQETGFTGNTVYSIAVSDDYFIACTSFSGIWIRPLQKLTITLTTNFEAISLKDTITVEIRNAFSPYNLIESKRGLGGQGVPGQFAFVNAENGTPYYLLVKHRNSVSTWSNVPQTFTNNEMDFDFTSAPTQAFGSNMVMANGEWSFYSGDVNRDGVVDLTDGGMIYNDIINFNSGYVSTDLNYDDITDLSDLLIEYNNSRHFVSEMHP